jgi:hypothetical protein
MTDNCAVIQQKRDLAVSISGSDRITVAPARVIVTGPRTRAILALGGLPLTAHDGVSTGSARRVTMTIQSLSESFPLRGE